MGIHEYRKQGNLQLKAIKIPYFSLHSTTPDLHPIINTHHFLPQQCLFSHFHIAIITANTSVIDIEDVSHLGIHQSDWDLSAGESHRC